MMMYNEQIMDCFFNPRHVGSLACQNCIQIECINQGWMILYIQLNPEITILEKIRFKAMGSPYIIAGMEWLCRQLEGKSLNLPTLVGYKEIIYALEIPAIRYAEAMQLQIIYDQAMVAIKERLNL